MYNSHIQSNYNYENFITSTYARHNKTLVINYKLRAALSFPTNDNIEEKNK